MCEIFGTSGYIATTYTYSPLGSVSHIGTVSQPIQWSSEFFDSETQLLYYNFRYYNPQHACWLSLDKLDNIQNNLYKYLSNIEKFDYLGLSPEEIPLHAIPKPWMPSNLATTTSFAGLTITASFDGVKETCKYDAISDKVSPPQITYMYSAENFTQSGTLLSNFGITNYLKTSQVCNGRLIDRAFSIKSKATLN
ncbi:MAG: RHS repeat-associated core domain-containing protein, partial [Oscillospiraceae bacterium]|nr:RHS repeat-associated core domain-containing protein [Oscillospiraceae bacterium]